MRVLTILYKCLLTSIIFLKLISCEGVDRKVEFDFTPEVIAPEKSNLNEGVEIKIFITSSVYNNGFLNHYLSYIGNRNSFLVSAKGDTIEIGESFVINNLDEWVSYKFYGKDLGEHNLKFTFKNSMGKEISIEKDILVES